MIFSNNFSFVKVKLFLKLVPNNKLGTNFLFKLPIDLFLEDITPRNGVIITKKYKISIQTFNSIDDRSTCNGNKYLITNPGIIVSFALLLSLLN